MKRRLIALLIAALALAIPRGAVVRAEGPGGGEVLTVVGRVVDAHEEPVAGAKLEARLVAVGQAPGQILAGRTVSASDGRYLLRLALPSGTLEEVKAGRASLWLWISKPTYRTASKALDAEEIAEGSGQRYLELADLELAHAVNAAFAIATLTFVLVFVLIAFRVFHETIAALVGAVVLLGVSALIGSHYPDYLIFSLERAIHYIDFDVIFLIMGMMIFMAILGQTGVFQWTAFAAYRLAKGRAFLLAALLTAITGALSALLDNVTTILLIVPVTIQLALLLDIHPFALLVPEIFAANIGGAGTLVGDPPNIIIGAFANLGFVPFLVHMGPLALAMMAVLLVMIKFIYRSEYAQVRVGPSAELLARLEEGTRITDRALLKKALIAFGATLILFILGGALRISPSVAALLGATVLLAWVRPDVHELMREVDWTTLVFFMGLFIVVGGIQEVGLIGMAADLVKGIAGDNLVVATVLLVWLTGLVSAVVDNIPFTAAVLPIAAYLTKTIPGAGNNILYWAISAGACFGGNGTTIGSSSNIVARGIVSRAGYRLTFGRYLRVAGPVTLIILILTTLWLLVRY